MLTGEVNAPLHLHHITPPHQNQGNQGTSIYLALRLFFNQCRKA